MAQTRDIKVSFGGGEVSPEMFGRIDDAKTRMGLATCRNFIVKPQGPVENRAGFIFVREVKDSSKEVKILPFSYSATQTMAIEMGAGYFRFHTQGATLMVGACTAWAGTHSYVVGDLVSESGTNYYCTTAHSSGTFATDLAAGKWYALPASGEYEIPNPYAEADLFEINFDQSADVLTLVHTGYAPRELRRLGATNWTLTSIAFAASIAAPTGVSATPYCVSPAYGYSYVVTAVAADGVQESVASSVAYCLGNVYETGAINTVAWSAVSGASYYNVYKKSGGIFGFIGRTSSLSIDDDNINPDNSVAPPSYDTVFSGAGNYPGAVSYYEQRRAFAGSINEPQHLWMTRSGTESAMSYSLPVRDDDRIKIRVAARENNTIRHIVPLSALLLLTSAAEWRVTSVNSDAITPSSISVRSQSYIGAGPAQPVICNANLLFAAADGGHLRECSYNWQASGFITGDLSLRATHLFDGYDITNLAFSKAPIPIAWAVSTSGKLLGITYIPEQQIGAWHQHDTLHGTFKSCAAVKEGTETRVYAVIKRLINGSYVRYIERSASRLFTDQADAFFVDSGMSFDGTNLTADTMTVSGGSTWGPGETLTLTASAPHFAYPATTDVGDQVVLYYTYTDSEGVEQTAEYRLTIDATSSTTVASARVDKILPAALRTVATASWAWARTSFSGIDHLEGETVNILADGAVHPQCVVASGAIALDTPAVKVQAGLPITADIKTLPFAQQVDGAYGAGRPKNVNRAWLRVYRSSGIWMGPTEDKLIEHKQRTYEPYGSPPALTTDEVEIPLTPEWSTGGEVFVRQSDPLPLTITSMAMEVSIGG